VTAKAVICHGFWVLLMTLRPAAWGIDGAESERMYPSMASNSERLFNAIVILGASLVAGCGGTGDTKPKGAPGPSASGDASGPNYVANGDASTSDAGWTGW